MILALINGLGDRNFFAGERSPLLYFYCKIMATRTTSPQGNGNAISEKMLYFVLS